MHLILRSAFSGAAILLLTATAAQAQRRIYVNEYLNIGVGGRGLAMAGAQTATVSDINSAFYNPAGLTGVQTDYQIGLMHAEYFSGNAKYDFGSIAMPIRKTGRTIGLSVLRFAVDDIPNTIDYVQADGSFDESKLKSMTAGDYAFVFTYAQKLKIFKNEAWQTSIGANAKVLYRHLSSMATAWGAGLDVGVQARYKQWRLGVSVRDITTTVTSWSFNLTEEEKRVFFATGNEIPVKSSEVMLPRISLGAARDFIKPGKKIQVTGEIAADLTTDGRRNTVIATDGFSIDPRAGLEASYRNVVFLRAGVGNIQRVLDDADTTNTQKITLLQPSAGLGLRIGKSLAVDYAFTSLTTQANPLYSHIISLRLDIRRAPKGEELLKPLPAGTQAK
jgi:hypothetical protein